MVLPGVYALAGDVGVALRARAALHLEPAAVVTGAAAAALTWWPELRVPCVTLASTAKRVDGLGIRWERRRVPPELVLEEDGLRATAPALTVLDLLPTLGGGAIDEVLRRRAVTLAQVEEAFAMLPPRRGDALRRHLLADSRDEPWSEAERHLHRCYRSLELPHRYATNHRVDLPDGTHRLLDLALPDLLLGFEADGYAHHHSVDAFNRDRLSDAALAILSWQRIRFPATAILDDPETVRATMRAVTGAARGRSRRSPRRRRAGRCRTRARGGVAAEWG